MRILDELAVIGLGASERIALATPLAIMGTLIEMNAVILVASSILIPEIIFQIFNYSWSLLREEDISLPVNAIMLDGSIVDRLTPPDFSE